MKKLLFSAFSLFLYSHVALTQLRKLDTQEAKVLEEIGKKLGLAEKQEWKFDKNLCSGAGNWGASVLCDCSYESNTTCHVVGIFIRSQNVSTALPSDFTKLRYLKDLDLKRNYLSGTIPFEWATMRLSTLSLMGNRLSGPFPTALTRMITLLDLSIEGNRFSGPIPQAIGNLKFLNSLLLSSNDFTGELPVSLAKLTNLTDLRISDNNFTGKIPSFISQLTQLGKLHIQGCSFEGSFPSSISVLTQLNDLRISDLKERASTFPPIEKMTSLKILVLRNCLINGTIPNYFGNLRNLITLDLSFNNLTGGIPSSFSLLGNAEHIYLTENKLTGSIPGWVLSSNKDMDVSYNHFTWDASSPKKCDQGTINLLESYSSSANKDIHPCLRKDFPCNKSNVQQIYSLYINCGGEEVTINNSIIYKADAQRKGASSYYNYGDWAFSNTGYFLDAEHDSDVYILSNTSNLNIPTFDTDLYITARTSAISLTYYGLCLMNGNYTVRLHFAEIVFTRDNSFKSLGKRVFNVYVQGELKLKDFDIVKDAGGTGVAVIKSYIVNVKNNTLKIQLYWAGKGTTEIPLSGNYGPIISAISIEPNFKPPSFGKKIDLGIILGTVGGGLLFVLLIIGILWRKGYIMGKKATDTDLTDMDLQTGIFTLRQIKAATRNFDPSNKLGEGGFGAVYKGLLLDGTIIAVKQLSSKSKQGAREFVNEVGMISALQHPNLVRLYGCCVEGNQMSLIYEYMANNCLSHALLGTNKVSKAKLTWSVRLKICIEIARGLVYLHEESHLTIIHRDIKASNILLDENFNAKISDFGLAKLNDDEGSTHIITRIAGTVGYMAPEYAMRGILSPKADVYSFGILALEIVSGKSNNYTHNGEYGYLLEWACILQEKGNLLELVDPDLGSEYSSAEALTILRVALLCADGSPKLRPTMSQTIDMLEGRTNIQDLPKGRAISTMVPKSKASKSVSWQDISETRPVIDEQYTESFITPSVITELS